MFYQANHFFSFKIIHLRIVHTVVKAELRLKVHLKLTLILRIFYITVYIIQSNAII